MAEVIIIPTGLVTAIDKRYNGWQVICFQDASKKWCLGTNILENDSFSNLHVALSLYPRKEYEPPTTDEEGNYLFNDGTIMQ